MVCTFYNLKVTKCKDSHETNISVNQFVAITSIFIQVYEQLVIFIKKIVSGLFIVHLLSY